MSELTHINCVALTARFPVGKPCRASCINESANPRGEAVCVLGPPSVPPSLTRCARAFGCGERYHSLQRGEYGYPTKIGEKRGKKMVSKRPTKRPGTLKRPRCGGFS
eukprot:FR736046.1.p4 GENE.FR736046.1~~FR736046.1.p4  ORF type:complete len:107 (+),score=6.26 FR736046.1:684-1004(+)